MRLLPWRMLSIPLLCLLFPGSPNALAGAAAYPGGSDYNSYTIENCNGNHYGVISNYNQAKDIIDRQLKQMYANGQRRLGLYIFFGHGLKSPPLVDSSAADLDAQYKANLAALLASMKSIGFQEVLIDFGPQGPNFIWHHGHEWPEWQEDLYQEHLKVIIAVRAIVAASGLRYRLDLSNEGIPAWNQPLSMRYSARLWQDYVSRFGKSDTVGFSIIPNPRQARIDNMLRVYGGNPPDVIDIHVYFDAARVVADAGNRLGRLGLGTRPWIIGEALYNDSREADELAAALPQYGVRLLYLLQWPLSRSEPCRGQNPGYDAVPIEFAAYHSLGF
jgi:hypothetical protein